MAADTDSIRLDIVLQRPGFQLALDVMLPGAGIIGLWGRSGAGKTSVLRALAGLEPGARGLISIKGEPWQDDARGIFVPTHQRPLGYVMQQAHLFPHLSVRGNLEYGQSRIPPAARWMAFEQAVGLLELGHLLARRPATLSGGERQRVAMGRALLTSPRVLLMDEPLSALDVAHKAEILPYLERLHRELDLPMLYVSHVPDELARLCDHLVLLAAGRVLAQGPLHTMLARLDLPLGQAEDAGVVLEATIDGHEPSDRLTRLTFAGGTLLVAQRPETVGTAIRCRVHARDVSLTLRQPVDTSILNIMGARVVELADAGCSAHVMVRLDVSGIPLLARITRRSMNRLSLRPGLEVWAQIKTVALLDQI
jgi:molybdate transport system ATP-binding protein